MKSKKSFFNKTIFWKNVTLYWPIWGIYTAVLVCFQPVILWISSYNAQYYKTYTYGDRLENLIEVLMGDYHDYLIAFVALFAGMALFNYLYNHKSANMIHALPVDRTQLFCTNVISGLAFLMVPQILSGILTVIVALCNGIHEVHYVGIWLLQAFGTDFIAMAVVTFCGMFTGHILTLPAYAIIVNYLSYWVYYIVYMTIIMFGYGVSSIGRNAQQVAAFFSPLESLIYNVGFYTKRDAMGECTGMEMFGVEVLLIYIVVSIVLFVVAFITYQKRHIEQAGEFITVGWVKPIFRFGVGITGGFFGGMIIREILISLGIGCGVSAFVVIMLLLGAIAYFAADMLIHKSFRVFKKKNWIGCGIFSVVMVCAFFGLFGLAKSYEDYQPDIEEIADASVNLGYEIQLEGEEVAVILDIHDQILANKEICIAEEERGNWNYEYVSIDYHLKNGEYVSRSYELPVDYEEIVAILDVIAEMEQDVDNYLAYTFVKNYEDIELFNGGWFEAQFMDKIHTTPDGEIESYGFDTKEFTSEQAKEMYEAVIADAKAGTLMKHNVHTQWVREGNSETPWSYSEVSIYIEFQNPNEEHDTHIVLEEYSMTYPGVSVEIYEDAESWYGAHILIGPDCENIVNKLIEFGFIESVDDIWWGEIEE